MPTVLKSTWNRSINRRIFTLTQVQKLTIRASEIRSKLLDFSQQADLSRRTTRRRSPRPRTNLGNTEIQLRAALRAEGDTQPSDGGENSALARLSDRANVGNIFQAVIERRSSCSGAEKEIQDHFKLPADMIPLEMLEQRAVATVPASTSHTPAAASQAPILQPAFALGDSAWMGIFSPRVEAGAASFPVLTTRPTVHGPSTTSTSHAETDGAFSAELLEPGRISAAFSFRRTDLAKFPNMDQALRLALSSGLSERLDSRMVAQIVSDVSRTSSSAVATHTTYLSRLAYGLVTGRRVSSESELRVLIGNETLVSMASLYRNTSSGERNAIERLRDITAGVRISAHVPAATTGSNPKQDCIVRLGSGRQDAVAPVWQGIQLLVDEISGKATGIISLTAILLVAFKVIETDGWKRVQVQHS